MSGFFVSMRACICIAITLLASAVSSQPVQLQQQQRFNYSAYYNGNNFDSLLSSPNGTRCFNARQEFVGVTDWFLTGDFVYSQFRNMDSQPFQCKVKFTADPAESWSSFESGWYTIKNASQSVWTEWTVTLLDWPGAANWIDLGIVLPSARTIDFIKFALVAQLSCVRNVMVACNSGASGGTLGVTAMSLGIPWENCGPDGMGVRQAAQRLQLPLYALGHVGRLGPLLEGCLRRARISARHDHEHQHIVLHEHERRPNDRIAKGQMHDRRRMSENE